MAPVRNGRLLFAEVPTGYPEPGRHTKYDDSEFIDLDSVPLNGGFLVKNLALSIDPYLRHRMINHDSPHLPKGFDLGKPLDNLGVGIVLRTESPSVKPGQHIYGFFPFQEYFITSDTKGIRIIENKENLPWTAYTGVLGLAGQTAWYAWKEWASPKKGETVFVTTGAGAVGSLVIQLAKKAELKVIASAGSKEKVEFMRRLGADIAFNYKTESTAEILKKEGPIDIYWDNVGGEVLDLALQNAACFARFIECGMIAGYNQEAASIPTSSLMNIIGHEIKLYGFIVSSLKHKYEEDFYREVPQLVAQGEIKYSEDVTDGLKYAGHALTAVQTGTNTGKSVILVSK